MTVLLGIFGLIAPRVTIFVLWFFTSWFQGVFQTKVWPILGFLFLPLTTLWYSVVEKMYSGEWSPWQIGFLVIAVLIDLGSGNASKGRRHE